jgi:hypothetical protein
VIILAINVLVDDKMNVQNAPVLLKNIREINVLTLVQITMMII